MSKNLIIGLVITAALIAAYLYYKKKSMEKDDLSTTKTNYVGGGLFPERSVVQ